MHGTSPSASQSSAVQTTCNLAPLSYCQLTPQYCNKLKYGGCGLLLCWCCGEVIGEQRAYDHFADGACLVTCHVKLTAAGANAGILCSFSTVALVTTSVGWPV